MKNSIRQIYFTILIIILLLSWKHNSFASIFYLNNEIEASCNYNDFSSCCSHSNCNEEDNIISCSKIKSDNLFNGIYVFQLLNDIFKNKYITNIWQPPKVS